MNEASGAEEISEGESGSEASDSDYEDDEDFEDDVHEEIAGESSACCISSLGQIAIWHVKVLVSVVAAL